jgi:hypothetical protein
VVGTGTPAGRTPNLDQGQRSEAYGSIGISSSFGRMLTRSA